MSLVAGLGYSTFGASVCELSVEGIDHGKLERLDQIAKNGSAPMRPSKISFSIAELTAAKRLHDPKVDNPLARGTLVKFV